MEINRSFGMDALTDGKKLIVCFSDLAPQLSRQRRILNYFVEYGGPGEIVSVMNASDYEQEIYITKDTLFYNGGLLLSRKSGALSIK